MKKIIAISAILSSVLATNTQAADTGTINFEGQLISGTCNAVVDGGSTANGTVTLPTLNVSAFASAASAGETPFTINLSECSGTATQVIAYFEGTNLETNGYLKNTGSATNVVLELKDSAGTHIKVGDALQLTENAYTNIATNAAVLDYTVSYFKMGATPGPGTVANTVTYAINYK